MTHDEKCELPKDFAKLLPEEMVLAHIFGEGCSCADRAIAKARREGRIEAWCRCSNGWADSEGYVHVTRAEAEACVDIAWPEDKP